MWQHVTQTMNHSIFNQLGRLPKNREPSRQIQKELESLIENTISGQVVSGHSYNYEGDPPSIANTVSVTHMDTQSTHRPWTHVITVLCGTTAQKKEGKGLTVGMQIS